jgi:hypothetical protein
VSSWGIVVLRIASNRAFFFSSFRCFKAYVLSQMDSGKRVYHCMLQGPHMQRSPETVAMVTPIARRCCAEANCCVSTTRLRWRRFEAYV